MIKEKLVQLVADAVGEKFALRTVALHIENAYNTIVGQVFVQNPNQLDFYAKPYEADVVDNYALFPVPVIQNADNAKGCRSIHDLKNTMRFYAIPVYALDSSSDVTRLPDFVFYAVRSDRAEFLNLPKMVKKVLMSLVVPFSEWGDKEDLPIPSGVADNIVALAIQTLNAETQVHSNAYKTK